MASNGTLLCIHRDPAQLSSLREQGYELVTATNGSDGLRLFMSRPVDAIVLEYHLGLLDGAVVADEIKQVRPEIPIVMLTDHLELPSDALKSVDALLTTADGIHLLLATVHFMLEMKPAQRRAGKSRTLTSPRFRAVETLRAGTSQLSTDERNRPFPPRVWRSIRNGSIQF